MQLDKFTQSYVETALWASIDDDDQPLDSTCDATDIAPATLVDMAEDCKQFQADNADTLSGFDAGRAGHDFWLTRNRHGAGFWDGDYPEPQATKLTDAAHVWGEYNLYIGDDDLVYSS